MLNCLFQTVYHQSRDLGHQVTCVALARANCRNALVVT